MFKLFVTWYISYDSVASSDSNNRVEAIEINLVNEKIIKKMLQSKVNHPKL